MKNKVALKLRPYNTDDADTILSWCNGEKAFYKWTAGVLGKFPLTKEQINSVINRIPFTAIKDDELVGFFIMRIPSENPEELRFVFVIVNPKIRGKGF